MTMIGCEILRHNLVTIRIPFWVKGTHSKLKLLVSIGLGYSIVLLIVQLFNYRSSTRLYT